jgi:phosphohistidine phosphatase
MQILFLRHGEADWPDWDKPDDERPLTRRGQKEMKRVAEFIERLEFSPDAILSSPLPRARQTAEIVAERMEKEVKIEPKLAHGFNSGRLREMITNADVERLIIVGHEPEFSQVIQTLAGGRVKLSKAGVALLEVDRDGRLGELRWLFPPKIARAAKL